MSKTNQTLDELLWKLQHQTLLQGYDENHRSQQINRNTTKQLISELLVECVPERQGSAALFDRVQRAGFENLSKYSAKALGYNQAIDDYENNIKARLQ